MLPAAPSSCAGWWFAQLWQALLRRRPDRHTTWLLSYPEPGELRLRSVVVPSTPPEGIAGAFHEGAERRCMVAWEWPGEDGMFHSLRLLWQPGEVIVRPIDWVRDRQPFPTTTSLPDAVPWPLRVRIRARGWHGQILERAELEAADGARAFPIRWEPPLGEPRLPVTELPCSLTMLDRQGSDGIPALSLAGLTLPWRIDLDRDAWAVWRRLSAGDLLRRLGGPKGICPRHGRPCPWPITGRISPIG
jgi:hypothetical protein